MKSYPSNVCRLKNYSELALPNSNETKKDLFYAIEDTWTKFRKVLKIITT